MAAWKLTRVRSEGFSKTRPRTRPSREGVGSWRACAAFRRAASANRWWISSAVRSSRSMKCRMMSISGNSVPPLPNGERGEGDYGLPLCLVRQQYFFQHGAALIELLVGQGQGRQQPDDGAVRAVDEQPPLEALLHDWRPLHGQLDADHDALDADLLHQRAAAVQ